MPTLPVVSTRRLRPEIVTPPAAALLTLSEAREWVGLGSGAGNDAKLTALLLRSERAAEDYLRRAIQVQTRRAVVRLAQGSARIEPWRSMQTIEASAGYYGAGTKWFSVDFDRPDEIGLPDTGVIEWASYYAGGEWIRLTYTAGWDSVPSPVKSVMLDHVQWSYTRRGATEQVFDWAPISPYRW